MRTLFVWVADLALYYSPLGGSGNIGEQWDQNSWLQARASPCKLRTSKRQLLTQSSATVQWLGICAGHSQDIVHTALRLTRLNGQSVGPFCVLVNVLGQRVQPSCNPGAVYGGDIALQTSPELVRRQQVSQCWPSARSSTLAATKTRTSLQWTLTRFAQAQHTF